MNERLHDRLFAGFGIASVVLMLVGAGIATTGHDRNLTISSSAADVARGLAEHAGTAMWIGAYIELLSFGCFIAFAAWACAKLGGGLLGQIARSAATAYATVSVAALALMDAMAYRSGKGIGVELAQSLIAVEQALYVCTWFLAAFFLLAAGPLALAAGRRALGFGAIGVAVLQLAATAASVDNVGQMTFMLWLAWILFASISLARRKPVRAAAPAVAQVA
jgi:hypothetical protein